MMITRHYQDSKPLYDSDTASRHAEWLMDEAIRDSFPASDPASSSQPGSIVYERYALTVTVQADNLGRFPD